MNDDYCRSRMINETVALSSMRQKRAPASTVCTAKISAVHRAAAPATSAATKSTTAVQSRPVAARDCDVCRRIPKGKCVPSARTGSIVARPDGARWKESRPCDRILYILRPRVAWEAPTSAVSQPPPPVRASHLQNHKPTHTMHRRFAIIKLAACAALALGSISPAPAEDKPASATGTWTWSTPGRDGGDGTQVQPNTETGGGEADWEAEFAWA